MSNNKDRAEAITLLNKYINSIIPKIQDCLNDGFKVTNDYYFYKKDKQALDLIVYDDQPEAIQATFRISDSQISINFKVRYESYNRKGWHYFNKSIILIGGSNREIIVDFKQLPIVTEQEITEANAEIEKCIAQIRELEYKINSLSYIATGVQQ